MAEWLWTAVALVNVACAAMNWINARSNLRDARENANNALTNEANASENLALYVALQQRTAGVQTPGVTLPPMNPVPSMELSQFNPGDRAVSELACKNYSRLYAQEVLRAAGLGEHDAKR